MTTRRLADRYLADKRKMGTISRRTEQQMRYQLHSFTDLANTNPAKLTKRDVKRWLRANCHLSANSRRQGWNRIHGYTDWLRKRSILHVDPFDGLTPPKVPRSVHRTLGDAQVRALLDACAEPRETVIVVLGVQAGLRRAELAGLEVGDIDLAHRTLLVRRGKGGHERLLPLSTEATQVVARYVADAGLCSGPLLRSLSNPQAGIGPHTVGIVFTRLAYRSSVKVRAFDGVGCHSSRHTFATGVYEATSDPLAVRDLLGHQSLESTQIYVRGLGVERLRLAVEGRRYLGGAA